MTSTLDLGGDGGVTAIENLGSQQSGENLGLFDNSYSDSYSDFYGHSHSYDDSGGGDAHFG